MYFFGIFGGIYNLFSRMMYYESQFSVNSYFHKLMEVARTLCLAFVVINIKNVELIMDPNSNESMLIAIGLFAESLISIVLALELYFFAEGDTSSIRNQVGITLTYYIPMMGFYLGASVVAGHGYGNGLDYNSWNVGDLPMALLFFAMLYSLVWDLITAFTVWSEKNSNIKLYMVPMNIDYQIHRFGEFTMLFFGEAVLSLLIVGHNASFSEYSNSNSIYYYGIAMVGVVNTIILQWYKYETEHHHAEHHCLLRGNKYLLFYTWFTMLLCITLVTFAISFKLALKDAVKYSDNASEYNDRMLAGGEYYVPEYLTKNLFCWTLAGILGMIEMMMYSHSGLKSFVLSFNMQRLLHDAFTWALIILIITLPFWVDNFMTMAGIGFAVSTTFFICIFVERYFKKNLKNGSNNQSNRQKVEDENFQDNETLEQNSDDDISV